jgi:Tfp pilus assembly protein PilF
MRHWLLALALLAILLPARAEEEAPDPEVVAQAAIFWQQGYRLHAAGQYPRAAQMFRMSIAVHPTAEGHTFLGWSLSHMGRLEEAIEECRTAIEIDPDFGNPYNDIGVYLMDLERYDEAGPWFLQAMEAARCCCYQFPHFNYGRLLVMQGDLERARHHFHEALRHEPGYTPARRALELLAEMGEEL